MATEQPKPPAKGVKMNLFEDDDKFEEFAIDQEWEDKEKGKEVTQQLHMNLSSSQHWTMSFVFQVRSLCLYSLSH